MKKKITIIALSLVLAFSTFAFLACNILNTGADEPCPTIALLRRIEELEYKLARQSDRVAELKRENQALRDRVAELERELLRAKYGDFKLRISIYNPYVVQGKYLTVVTTLYNLTEQSFYYYSPFSFSQLPSLGFHFMLNIPDWQWGEVSDIDSPPSSPWFFEKNSYMQNKFKIGAYLDAGKYIIYQDIGVYQVSAKFNFCLNLGQDNSQTISLFSKTVYVTVLER